MILDGEAANSYIEFELECDILWSCDFCMDDSVDERFYTPGKRLDGRLWLKLLGSTSIISNAHTEQVHASCFLDNSFIPMVLSVLIAAGPALSRSFNNIRET